MHVLKRATVLLNAFEKGALNGFGIYRGEVVGLAT